MSWFQIQRQQAEAKRKAYLANQGRLPVTDAEISQRLMEQLDADDFPLDTPSGQVLNPQLAALIAEGMLLPDNPPDYSLPPIGSDLDAPYSQAQRDPNFQEESGKNSAQFLMKLLSNLPAGVGDVINSLRPEQPERRKFGTTSTKAPTATTPNAIPAALPEQALAQELMGPPQPPLNNNAEALMQSLVAASPQQEQAASEELGFFQRLGQAFESPYMQELMLQTGLGLARSETFGQALTSGVEGARAQKVDAAKDALLSKQLQANLAKTQAEAGKLNSETLKILNELDSGEEPLSENDYSRVFTDMQKHVSSDIFRMADDSPFKLDSETYARYLTNSGLRPESRRYGMLKGEYVDFMADIWQQVQRGTAKQSNLESRLDEYEVAFGPEQTAQMILRLQGK